ncbi:MAG TPA: hypothetical protein VGD46_18385 [Rhizobacter sp.]
MNRRRILLSLWLAASLASGLSEARAATPSVVQDLRMAQDSQPFRRAADEFVARSMAGDVAGTHALLSRGLVERTGDEAVKRVLQSQILPFFQRGREPGRSVTIARTTDAAGQQGFAFYMWMQYADATPAARPFTVYVVKEEGRLVVANVVPDRLVEGRHR